MSTNILDTLFGAISKEYCILFYIIEVFAFISLVFFLVTGVAIGISKRKGIEYYLQVISGSIVHLMIYIGYRLLYSMCVGSV